MLNITTKREGENLLVRLDGQLDRLTAPQLYDTLTANLDGVKNLTLDFEKLEGPYGDHPRQRDDHGRL